MLTFTLQTWDTITGGSPHYFAIFFIVASFYFLLKAIVARYYRPFTTPCNLRARVVIPVVDEDVREFTLVLGSIRTNHPFEIIVVINGQKNPALEAVCNSLRIPWIFVEQPGKRNAVIVGTEWHNPEARDENGRHVESDVIVLVDSDTTWTGDTLEKLMMPFSVPSVGGVTTNQKVYRGRRERRRNWYIRFAAWMEDIRTDYSMRAMSVFGTVGCLPGRTIAFRRDVITENQERFMNETFLGIFLEVSDDRTLTNYALQMGYKTVFQVTSQVWTDAPRKLRVYLKQQLRWSRGSQYNNLRMSWWMARNAKFLGFIYFMDTIIPFFWLGTVINLGWKIYVGHPLRYGIAAWQQAALIAGGLLLSAALRNLPHLRRQKDDIKYLPMFVLMLSLVLTPIRIIGFFRMAHDASWGTRKAAHGGGGQVHALNAVPYFLGTLMLVFFGVIGPLIETPERFIDFLTENWHTLTASSLLLSSFCILVTLRRYLMSLWRRRRSSKQLAVPPHTGAVDPEATGDVAT